MNEPIPFPIEYLGAIHELPLTIVQTGYTYQLHIQVSDHILVFEKDDAGAYRVIDSSGGHASINKGLIQAIISALEKL